MFSRRVFVIHSCLIIYELKNILNKNNFIDIRLVLIYFKNFKTYCSQNDYLKRLHN